MVKYKLSWVPSVSAFAATQNVKGTIDGVTTSFGTFALNVAEVEYSFTEGVNVDWFVETVGENAKTSESVHDVFVAINDSVPAPATALAHTFVEFVP